MADTYNFTAVEASNTIDFYGTGEVGGSINFTGSVDKTGDQGIQGEQGDPGQGVPLGGTTGQALTKDTNADYATEWTTIDKTFVGLGNVDNTSDANKPVSSATQTALNGKANTSHTHTATNITDFDEAVEDKIGTKIVAGTNVSVSYNDTTGNTTISASSSGMGDVVGPSSATDNALARFDTTTGKLIQNSVATLDDTGKLVTPATVRGSDFELSNVNGSYAINAYFSSGWKYIGTGPAFLLNADGSSGGARYYTAPSGTANAAITFTEQAYVSPTGFQFTTDATVPDEAYGSGWNGSTEIPTKNAVYDKIESLTSGSGITRSVVVTSNNVAAGAAPSTDYVYLVAGNHTVTLPTAVGNTNRYTVKNNHSAAITVNTTSSQTIDGTTSIQIAPEDSVDLISTNAAWSVM